MRMKSRKRKKFKHYNKNKKKAVASMVPIIDVGVKNYSSLTVYTSSKSSILNAIDDEIGHLFKSFEPIGDTEEINIEGEPLTSCVRKYVRDFYCSRHILTSIDGTMEKILYPYKGKNYFVNIIFNDIVTDNATVENDKAITIVNKNISNTIHSSVDTQKSSVQHVALRCVLSQFANSIGYHLDTEKNILSIRIKSPSGKEHLSKITSGIKKILAIFKLEQDVSILNTPEIFAEWVLSSPRYDSYIFEKNEPGKVEKELKENDEFTKNVYDILQFIDVVGEVISNKIDMQDKNFDISKVFLAEYESSGKYVARKIKNICNKIIKEEEQQLKIKSNIVTGKTLKKLGYVPGPIYQEIMEDVYGKFNPDTKHSEVVKYILENFPIVKNEEENELHSVVKKELNNSMNYNCI